MPLFTGCESEEEFAPLNYVSFEDTSMDFTVNENSSGSFDVTLYTSNKTGSDRTFEIVVDESSTLNSAAFIIPSSVVVPANSNEATFTVEVTDSGISNTGETLVLALGDEEGLYRGQPLNVNVFRFCEVNINDYIGTFTGPGSWNAEFGYTTEVETFLNEDGDLMINGLVFQWFQDWWGEVIVTNQPVKININEETGAITIPEQPYITSTYNGDPQPAYSIKATGMVNACEKTLIIYPVLVQGGTDIDGTAWASKFVETITLVDDSGTDEETEEEETEE